VTEMISSVDLIEEQIRVAVGEKLRYKQVPPRPPWGSPHLPPLGCPPCRLCLPLVPASHSSCPTIVGHSTQFWGCSHPPCSYLPPSLSPPSADSLFTPSSPLARRRTSCCVATPLSAASMPRTRSKTSGQDQASTPTLLHANNVLTGRRVPSSSLPSETLGTASLHASGRLLGPCPVWPPSSVSCLALLQAAASPGCCLMLASLGQVASTRTCRRGALSLGWTATCMRTTWCPPATTPCSARWALAHSRLPRLVGPLAARHAVGGDTTPGARRWVEVSRLGHRRGASHHTDRVRGRVGGLCASIQSQGPCCFRCRLAAGSLALACAAPLSCLPFSPDGLRCLRAVDCVGPHPREGHPAYAAGPQRHGHRRSAAPRTPPASAAHPHLHFRSPYWRSLACAFSAWATNSSCCFCQGRWRIGAGRILRWPFHLGAHLSRPAPEWRSVPPFPVPAPRSP
jgi:hypothetical protein